MPSSRSAAKRPGARFNGLRANVQGHTRSPLEIWLLSTRRSSDFALRKLISKSGAARREMITKRVSILTSGGDAAGMHAAIRADVWTTLDVGWEGFGVRRGYAG